MPVAISSPHESIVLEPQDGGGGDNGEILHSFLFQRIQPRRLKVQIIPVDEQIGAGGNRFTNFSSGLKAIQSYEIGGSVLWFLDTISKKIQERAGRIYQQGFQVSPRSKVTSRFEAYAAAEVENSRSAAFEHILRIRELENKRGSYVVGMRAGVVHREFHRELLAELDEVLSCIAVAGEDECVDGEGDSRMLEEDLVLVDILVDGQIEISEDGGRDELLFGIRG